MIAKAKTRWLIACVGVIAAACVVIAATATLANLPAFDEPLIPELQALKVVRPPVPEQNAYPIALGFLAANDVDPRVVGEAMLKALHERYEAGQRMTIPAQDMRALLGTASQHEELRSQFKSLECNARVYLDCANRLIAEVAEARLDGRLAVLFARFETLSRQQRFDEGQERDAYTPVAPYDPILDVARIRLAQRFGMDSSVDFIAQAANDLRFWRLMLRDGDTLVAKMIAIAGLQNTLDFLSALLRDRALTAAEVQSIRELVSPLTREEADIGEAFLAEARSSVLTDTPPLAMGASRLDRWLLQRNATLNGIYSDILLPMRFRAALSPSEFYREGGYQPLNPARRAFPPSLFNWGGARLYRNSGWDPQQFIARTHDENGRILLVLLQAELEQASGVAVDAVLEASSYRNPYTGKPMEYDVRSRTIGFQCLHTAFHPPASPDRCVVAIGKQP
ncbi:MAG TPA: hypothetical protein PKE27_13645 [Povalibacter sp.]|uniref:hypothetical protein n=1 Tax=Povalibacter sp. TaxID=1962978 RepID=UPI002B7B30AF|nr:hypothetical protein [Povalibacter sp.]HMN45623.1 hypothetical protein [Povalibacter sp.]